MIREFFNKVKGDKYIWIIVFILTLISLLAVYSSSGILAIRNNSEYYKYLMKHSFFVLVGVCVIYFTHLINYKHYAMVAKIAFWLGIPILLYTLFFGSEINNAARWIRVPGTDITFLTSDFAKIILIMYLARVLTLVQDKILSFKEAFIPALIPIVIYCGLIFLENFSTAALLGLVSVIILFIAGIELKQLIGFGVFGVVLITIFFAIAIKWDAPIDRLTTWKNRIETFSGKDIDAILGHNELSINNVAAKKKSIYDIEQSDYAKIAIATAGTIGKGPGNSEYRNFLPHPYSDLFMLFIIEEYGMWGGILVVCLYLALLYRGIVIVNSTRGKFGALLAGGLTIMLVIQAFMHMAVNVNLLPTTGQTLPLISMGGTSIIFTSAAVGIILSVSRYNDENIKNKKIAINAVI